MNDRYTQRRTIPPELGAELRAARVTQGLGIREAARLVGTDRGYLSRIERGLRCPRPAMALVMVSVYALDERVATRLMAEASLTVPRHR